MLLCSIQWKIHFLGCCKGVPRGLKVFASTRDKHANNKCTSQHCRIIHSLITTSPGTLADSVASPIKHVSKRNKPNLYCWCTPTRSKRCDGVVFCSVCNFPSVCLKPVVFCYKNTTQSNIIVTATKAELKSKHNGKYTNFAFWVWRLKLLCNL